MFSLMVDLLKNEFPYWHRIAGARDFPDQAHDSRASAGPIRADFQVGRDFSAECAADLDHLTTVPAVAYPVYSARS